MEKRAIWTVILALIILVYLFPHIYMVLMSLRPPLEVFSISPIFEPTLSNYRNLFYRIDVLKHMKNSLIVALCSTAISVIIGSIAAYSISRLVVIGRKFYLLIVLFARMMPPIGSVLSLFLLIKALGLSGTYFSLIFIYVSFQAPFVIWLMRGFFASIPREMEESAMIDGCSRLQAFLRLIIPLSAPGLAATSVFVFTLSWNEFLFALIFTSDQTKTVPVVVPELITEMGIYWGEISGLGVIVIIPIAVFVFLTQKSLIKGLTFGAVKQ